MGRFLSIVVAVVATGCGGDDAAVYEPGEARLNLFDLPTVPGTSARDCDVPPPDDWDRIDFPYAGEEFAFDSEGHLVLRSDAVESVTRVDRDGDAEIVAPFLSDEVAGFDILPDGDFVIADEAGGAVVRMTPEGGESVILSALSSPNSIAVDADGMVYATAFDRIVRTVPGSMDYEVVVRQPDEDLDGLTFSPDFRYLWFNEDETGDVFRVRLQDDGDVGEPKRRARLELPNNEHQLDGMATDACGNVYVLRTDGEITRIFPDRSRETYADLRGSNVFTSSLHFGSGIGGWKKKHLYVMDRFGGLYDLDVGIEGAPEPNL